MQDFSYIDMVLRVGESPPLRRAAVGFKLTNKLGPSDFTVGRAAIILNKNYYYNTKLSFQVRDRSFTFLPFYLFNFISFFPNVIARYPGGIILVFVPEEATLSFGFIGTS